MSITYPLDLPSSPSFREVVLRPATIVSRNRSPYTGASQKFVFPGQWWQLDLTLPTLTDDQLAEWESFLFKLNGIEGTFLAGDPSRKTARGSCASSPGTPLVDGAVSANAQDLPIKGAPVLETAWLRAGDNIQVGTGSSSKLHKALETVDTDSNGDVTVKVWPRIRNGYAGDEVINFTYPKGVFELADNDMSVAKRIGVFGNISISAVEAL